MVEEFKQETAGSELQKIFFFKKKGHTVILNKLKLTSKQRYRNNTPPGGLKKHKTRRAAENMNFEH